MGAVQYIWKFKVVSSGDVVLTYKRQALDNSSDVIDTKIYKIQIN
jgi:hypothetical protein